MVTLRKSSVLVNKKTLWISVNTDNCQSCFCASPRIWIKVFPCQTSQSGKVIVSAVLESKGSGLRLVDGVDTESEQCGAYEKGSQV